MNFPITKRKAVLATAMPNITMLTVAKVQLSGKVTDCGINRMAIKYIIIEF